MDVTSSLQMDVSFVIKFFGVLFLGFLCGVLFAIIVVLCLFSEYTKILAKTYSKQEIKFKPVVLTPLLQQNLATFIENTKNPSKESCVFLNAILMFMFKEWRDTAEIQRWILKKINIELIELMETKAANRLLQAIKIHELSLGCNVPVIHGVEIVEPHGFNNKELPQSIILDVDIEYEGGFLLAVDVDLVFGKSAFISVCIRYLKGCVRVQFGRIPCTHWCVSFKQEPTLKFDVDTSFESRQLPQLGTLLTNQILRTIKRKHTLPHYKLRYNPFFAFQHPVQSLLSQNNDDVNSNFDVLDVTIVAFSRLAMPKTRAGSITSVVFATLSLDAVNCETLPALKVISLAKDKTHALNTQNDGEIVAQASDLKSCSTPETFQESSLVQKSFKQYLPSTDKLDGSVCAERKNPQDFSATKEVKDKPSQSYVMVTRNFSATLHEVTVYRPHNQICTNVNVLSLTGNPSSSGRSIRVGDRILEINRQKILSLSQAIAIIEKIRSRKEKFQFKVQRNRANSSSKNSQLILRNAVEQSDTDTESDYSDIDSDDYADIVSMDKKIKEIQKEIEKNASTPTLRSDSCTAYLHGHSRNQVNAIGVTNEKTSTSTEDSLTFAKLFQESKSAVFKTSPSIANIVEGGWENERFSLQVQKEHQYLNIRFWFNENNKASNIVLIGSLGIKLNELYLHCNLTTSCKFIKKYKISSPVHHEFRLNVEESFMKRSAFRKHYCFGDATVCVKGHKFQQ